MKYLTKAIVCSNPFMVSPLQLTVYLVAPF